MEGTQINGSFSSINTVSDASSILSINPKESRMYLNDGDVSDMSILYQKILYCK